MVGNAPISDVSYIGKSAEQLYKANYEYIEDSYGYLIYGTIKFEQPVTASDDGFTCILTAEISAIEMKHGKVVLTHNFSQTGTGANWNKCVHAYLIIMLLSSMALKRTLSRSPQ